MAKNTKEKDTCAQTLGSRGGKKGGPARAKSMTQAQRTASARKAGKARQNKK